jgi:protocatechuate 4,5-dioxygenase alpha subunit
VSKTDLEEGKLGPPAHIPGLFIYGSDLARRGYQLNKILISLRAGESTNRARFAGDQRHYLDSFNLSERERQLIQARDFAGILQHGANGQLLYRAALPLGLTAKELAKANGVDVAALDARLNRGGYRDDRKVD